MPNVRTHDLITTTSGVALFPISWVAVPGHSVTVALVISSAHLLAGLLFSPDLDIRAVNYRRWGPLRVLWWPYSKAIPHRSLLSHGLVIGPLLQLLYFVVVFGGLFSALLLLLGQHSLWSSMLGSVFRFMDQYPALVLAGLVGFVTGGASHSIPDWISTGAKRTWNSWTKY
jgi:uncharacterized metal-binding protein